MLENKTLIVAGFIGNFMYFITFPAISLPFLVVLWQLFTRIF